MTTTLCMVSFAIQDKGVCASFFSAGGKTTTLSALDRTAANNKDYFSKGFFSAAPPITHILTVLLL